MNDASRPVAPQYDPLRHTLTPAEVATQLSAAGVPRTIRHVQRLCANGSFDAARLGPNGEWYIAPDSVPKLIGDLRALDEQRARRAAAQHDTSRHVAPEMTNQAGTDTSRHDATQRDTAPAQNRKEEGATSTDTSRRATTEPDKSHYVALLERDNEFLREQVTKKDDQISDLSKRFSETQILLGAMQKMFAPLLGQGDPFTRAKDREVSDATTS